MSKPVIASDLYNALAKDFTPKKAAMNICRYMAGLEERIAAVESQSAKPKTSGGKAEGDK